MGTAAASAGAAGPSEGLGPDGAAGGLSRSTPRRADDTTTLSTTGAGRRVSPTTGTRSQTTCYVRRGTGRVVHCSIIAHFFLRRRSPNIRLGPSIRRTSLKRHLLRKWTLRLNRQYKRGRSFRCEFRHYPHSVCGIHSFASNREGLEEGNCRLARVTTVVSYSRIFLRQALAPGKMAVLGIFLPV